MQPRPADAGPFALTPPEPKPRNRRRAGQVSAARRAYNRAYYLAHRPAALAYQKAYYAANADAVKARERERKAQPEAIVARENAREGISARERRRPARRDALNVLKRLSRQRHPDREKARRLAVKALRDGVLRKPKHCEKCGWKTPHLEKHHPDYSQPLQVRFLCHTCHCFEDGRMRPGHLYIYLEAADAPPDRKKRGKLWVVFQLTPSRT